jgi:citrate lyase subunit beta / citryl-CoA lyase
VRHEVSGYRQLRSGLITPGLDPTLMKKASESAADFVHIELEDGVAPDRKAEARDKIVDALTTLDWADRLTMVRVNGVESGFLEHDVDVVVPALPRAVVLGKCGGPDEIKYLDRLITRVERDREIPHGTVGIAAMIERASAFATIDEIAAASPRMLALYIGPTDLGTELGYRRTYRGQELEIMFVRSRVVVAAHVAGLFALDSPTIYFRDLELTFEQARWSYQCGFDAKACISPRQIAEVNRAFTPSEEELRWAEEVLEGEADARQEGDAVWVRQGMMLDAAMIARARRTVAAAVAVSGSDTHTET